MSKRFYWKKIRPILLTVVLCSAFFLILMAITSNRTGNLTIYVDRSSVTKSLSISEKSDLSNPQGKIEGPSMVQANDALSKDIPSDLYLLDGDNSANTVEGAYLAYTFYVFNSGSETLDYSMKFQLENKSNNLDDAIMIRFYVNDELTTYAKKDKDSGEPKNGTVAFESDSIITSHTITDLEPKEATKYTIVLWIDQNYSNNSHLGGSVTLSLAFSVLGEL